MTRVDIAALSVGAIVIWHEYHGGKGVARIAKKHADQSLSLKIIGSNISGYFPGHSLRMPASRLAYFITATNAWVNRPIVEAAAKLNDEREARERKEAEREAEKKAEQERKWETGKAMAAKFGLQYHPSASRSQVFEALPELIGAGATPDEIAIIFDRQPGFIKKLMAADRQKILHYGSAKQTQRNREIMRMREAGLTFREIGERFGVSDARIVQIVATTRRRDARHAKAQAIIQPAQAEADLARLQKAPACLSWLAFWARREL